MRPSASRAVDSEPIRARGIIVKDSSLMKLYSATIKQQEETGLRGHYHQDLTVLENPIVLFVLTSESPILAYPCYINASHQYRPTLTILMRSVPDFGPTF